MLILGMKLDDYVVIETEQGNVKAKIFIDDNSSTLRLAIDAPREISITRGVAWEEMHPDDISPFIKTAKKRYGSK